MRFKAMPIFLAFFLMGLADAMGPMSENVKKHYEVSDLTATLLPFFVFKRGVRFILERNKAYLFYMHPWEIDPQQPMVKEAAYHIKLRHYINLKHSYSKLAKMFHTFSNCRFVTCRQYIQSI